MSIYLGSNMIKEIYLGSQKIGSIYLGTQKVYQSGPQLLYLSYFKDAQISGSTFTDVPLIMDSNFTPMSGNISGFSFSVETFSSQTANIPDSYINKSVTYIRGSKYGRHYDYDDVLTWTFPLTSSDVFSITWKAARVNRYVMDCIGFKVSESHSGIWSYGIWTASWQAGSNGRIRFYGSSDDYDLYNGVTYYTDSTYGNGPRFPENVINNGSGVWNNYAIVSDGNGNIYVYVNGILYLKKKSFTGVDLNKFFFGGSSPTGSQTYGGMLTELAVYPIDISINNHNNVPVLDDVIQV